MLRRHSELFRFGVFTTDMLTTGGAWLLGYYVRFHSDLVPVDPGKGMPEMWGYVNVIPFVLVVLGVCYWRFRLYVPRREGALFWELLDIALATLIGVGCLAAATFFYRGFSYSRKFAIVFAVTNTALMAGERCGIRLFLRAARERGWNLRYVLVAGAGKLGQMLVERIHQNAWTGLHVVGYVDDNEERHGQAYLDVPVLGALEAIPQLIQKHNVDHLFCCFALEEHAKLKSVMDIVADDMVDLRIVPDFVDFLALHSNVGDFDGLPVVSVRESPLHGWNMVFKRAMDIGGALAALALFGIPMLVITYLVKRSSSGPALYRQARMGLDGRMFQMLKFRSMRMDAEEGTGAVWASQDDPRRTRIGTILREWSLDELPQLLNVLKGDMSLVGPRPERPEFIEQFRTTVPKYMLRHKMKAGMTGWAQVNGWRGNTSLDMRIQHDLHYIENWSLSFDVWILFLTVFRGFRSATAY